MVVFIEIRLLNSIISLPQMAQSFVIFHNFGASRWDNVGLFLLKFLHIIFIRFMLYFSYMNFLLALFEINGTSFLFNKKRHEISRRFFLVFVRLSNFVDLYSGLVTWFTRHDNHISRGRSPGMFDEWSLVLWGSLFIDFVAIECYWNGASWLQVKFRL